MGNELSRHEWRYYGVWFDPPSKEDVDEVTQYAGGGSLLELYVSIAKWEDVYHNKAIFWCFGELVKG